MASSRTALVLALLALAGCATIGSPPAAPEPARLVGATSRAQIEAVRPEWAEETLGARPDLAAAQELLAVAPAEVKIYLGTWCSDSRRELTRLWRALDELPWEPPFELSYVAVDRDKREPNDLLAGVDLRYVPTFVVVRDGREIGRVIEEAPGGIENDLADLLTGRAEGWITAREDLAQPAADGGAEPGAGEGS